MNINIIVEGKKFEELSLDEQEAIKDKITDAQREIVIKRLVKMVREGRLEEIMDYLEYCSYYRENMSIEKY